MILSMSTEDKHKTIGDLELIQSWDPGLAVRTAEIKASVVNRTHRSLRNLQESLGLNKINWLKVC